MACTTEGMTTVITASGDITCKRGDDFLLGIDVTHEDDDTAHDLTVYSVIKMEVKGSANDITAVITFELSAGTISVLANTMTLIQAAAVMLEEAKEYVYDVQATRTSDGKIMTLGGGAFIIENDVTD